MGPPKDPSFALRHFSWNHLTCIVMLPRYFPWGSPSLPLYREF